MVHSEIEAINVFGGTDYLNVMELARHRNLQTAKFENLLMEEKAIAFYSGTAGFQTAINFILSQVSSEAKALSEPSAGAG